jgi:hypothetical protein
MDKRHYPTVPLCNGGLMLSGKLLLKLKFGAAFSLCPPSMSDCLVTQCG